MIETSFQGWDNHDVVSVSSNQRVQRVGKERMSSYKLVASEHVTGPDRSVDVDPANVRSRFNVDAESPVPSVACGRLGEHVVANGHQHQIHVAALQAGWPLAQDEARLHVGSSSVWLKVGP